MPNKWSRVVDKNKYASWLQDRVNHNFQAGDLMDIGVHSPHCHLLPIFHPFWRGLSKCHEKCPA
jgi:hypothetical protein